MKASLTCSPWFLSLIIPSTQPRTFPHFFRTARISRDFLFTCSSIFMVDAMANYSEPHVRSYLYDLNATIETPIQSEDHDLYLTVTHGSELQSVFDEIELVPRVSATLVKLGNTISGSWVYFSHTGAPTSQTNKTFVKLASCKRG